MTPSKEANPKQIKAIRNVQNGIKSEWKDIKINNKERTRKRNIWGKPSRRYSNINQNERKYTLQR